MEDTLTSESLWKGEDGRDEDVKTMMKSMLMVGKTGTISIVCDLLRFCYKHYKSIGDKNVN